MKVEIVSKKLIKPTIPTPVSLRKYKLSFFDQLAAPGYVGLTFFYPKHHTIGNAQRCDQLEKSLSESLSCFRMLSGTHDKDHLFINCDDHGVEVTRAIVHGELDTVVQNRPDTDLLDTFSPCIAYLTRSVPSPCLAIQLNLFSCGGLGLGIRNKHSILDGRSYKMFLDHWSGTNRLGLNSSPVVPSFELGSRFPARQLVGLKPPSPSAHHTKKKVTKCFVYTPSFVEGLKREARGRKTKYPPSKALVVTAHLWRTSIQASKTKYGYARPSMLLFAMNLQRIIPHVPPHSWGTLISHPTAWSIGDEKEADLSELIDLLQDAISKDKNVFSGATNADEIYSKLVDEFNGINGVKPLEEDIVDVTSLCGMGFYDAADFGWEKPIWISETSIPVELASLMDTKHGDGVEVWLTLNEDFMVEFERHFLDDDRTGPRERQLKPKL